MKSGKSWDMILKYTYSVRKILIDKGGMGTSWKIWINSVSYAFFSKKPQKLFYYITFYFDSKVKNKSVIFQM